MKKLKEKKLNINIFFIRPLKCLAFWIVLLSSSFFHFAEGATALLPFVPTLTVLPFKRMSVPYGDGVSVQCTKGNGPFRWEYHVQNMSNWRYEIRSNKANCLQNVTVRPISSEGTNFLFCKGNHHRLFSFLISENDHIFFNSSDGKLHFQTTNFSDTGIYRCWDSDGSCVEFHLLIFTPVSFQSELKLVYGLVVVILFGSLVTGLWQLWHSVRISRKVNAKQRSVRSNASSSESEYLKFRKLRSSSAGSRSYLSRLFLFFRRSRNNEVRNVKTVEEMAETRCHLDSLTENDEVMPMVTAFNGSSDSN